MMRPSPIGPCWWAQRLKRPDLRAVAEDSDAFAIRRRDDAGALVRNRERRSDREPALAAPSAGAVARPLAPAGHEMERRHASIAGINGLWSYCMAPSATCITTSPYAT